jgi:hypothetical protein
MHHRDGVMRGYNNGVRYGKHEMGRGMDRGGMMDRSRFEGRGMMYGNQNPTNTPSTNSPQIIQVTASTTIR